VEGVALFLRSRVKFGVVYTDVEVFMFCHRLPNQAGAVDHFLKLLSNPSGGVVIIPFFCVAS
jgi:hypothetical protein